MCVLVWRGSDIFRKGYLKFVKSRPYIKHVAISSFIADDLKRKNIKCKLIPVRGNAIDDICPEVKGDEIYTYVPLSKKHYKRYGGKLVDKIKKVCPYKINVITNHRQYSRSDLISIYKRCFCGFRFTKHDGLANTVVELGLMGRKCFYNDKHVPNSIPWKKDVESIMLKIEEEAKLIGSLDTNLANRVKKYVDVGDKWLKTQYWR
jgi:hypothetical protein